MVRRNRYRNPSGEEIEKKANDYLNSIFDQVALNPAVPAKYKKLLKEKRTPLKAMLMPQVREKAKAFLEKKEKEKTVVTPTPAPTPSLSKKEMIIEEVRRLLEDPATLKPYEKQIESLVLTEEEKALAKRLAA